MKIAIFYILVPTFEQYTRAFVQSYLRYESGRDHELVGVVKADNVTPHDAQLISANRWEVVGTDGYDIGPLLSLAHRYLDYDRIVLVGSYCRVFVDGWLSKLCEAGPLASPCGSYLERPHLRTSCFSATPSLLASMPSPVSTKAECWAFEHGLDSIYRTARSQGIEGVVVGRDGVYFEPDWQSSRTFWTDDQEGLIVSDKQTDRYANAGAEERAFLKGLAWEGKRP